MNGKECLAFGELDTVFVFTLDIGISKSDQKCWSADQSATGRVIFPPKAVLISP